MYDDVPAITSRFQELNALFKEKYGCSPDFYVRAPGRVNLIGEHIDYHGYAPFDAVIVQVLRATDGDCQRHDYGSRIGGE